MWMVHLITVHNFSIKYSLYTEKLIIVYYIPLVLFLLPDKESNSYIEAFN